MEDASGTPSTQEPEGDERLAGFEEQGRRRLVRAVEAIIFAADEPVEPSRLAEVFAEVAGRTAPSEETVAAVVERLNDTYETEGRPFRVERWGEGFQMATQEEWAPFVKTLLAGPRRQSLSRSLSETLAVVAYRQPVTRPEVDFIRGVSADYALRKLMELELVDVKGRSDSLGRPLLYGTTEHFLEEFGLVGLDDLPTLREVEELLDDPNFNKERAKLLQLRREEDAVEDAIEGSGEDGDAEEHAEGATEEGAAPTTSEEATSEEATDEEATDEEATDEEPVSANS
jgi:segregation and condensation protein B